MSHLNTDAAPREPAASSAVRLADVETWLTAYPRIVLFMIVLCSIGLRAIYFVELNHTPLIALERWNQTDMNYYDRWGRAIADGDWLSRTVGVPMHAWHHEVASAYFAGHVTEREMFDRDAALQGAGTTADSLLWAKWTGQHAFYQDPLYPYAIGVIYKSIARDPRVVLAVQLGLGVMSNVLIWLITRRYFGDLTAAVAATLAVLCAPLLHYELLLLRDSTIVFVSLLVIWLADRAFASRRVRWLIALGAVLGLAVLLKSTFALMAAALMIGVLIVDRHPRRIGYLVAGLALPIVLLAARNVAVGASPLSLAGSGPLTFVSGNGVDYPATGGFIIQPPEMARVLDISGPRMGPAIAATLEPHSIVSLFTLAWNKVNATLRWYEVPNNANYYYFREHAEVLQWLPITGLVIVPLGLVGIVRSRRQASELWPVYVVMAATGIGLIAFVVLGRLRVAWLAMLLPFAAVTIVHAVHASRRAALTILAVIIAIGCWTGRPLGAGEPLISVTDWMTPYWAEYRADVQIAIDAKDPGRAATAYVALFAYEPKFSAMRRAGAVLVDTSDRSLALEFAKLHLDCADQFHAADRDIEASEQRAQADALVHLAGK